jgi:hypothetical protein
MGTVRGRYSESNIDITISIPNLEKYAPETRDMFALRITEIIYETFVYSADYDYINARCLAISGQYRPFFWAALQAIEKYLKAHLLDRAVPVKKYGHKIVVMADDLKTKDTFLYDLKLVPRAEHQILEKNGLWGSTKTHDFLKTIYKYGDAHNRYDFYGAAYKSAHLFKLDQGVYCLRSQITNTDLLHKARNAGKLSYFAYEQNYYFAPIGYMHKSVVDSVMAMSVPSIEMALKGRYGYPHVFEQWLRDNIMIEDKQIDKIRKMQYEDFE